MRIADVWRARRERARETKAPRGGVLPWWIVRRQGGFALDPARAAAARAIVLLTAEGLGRKKLVKAMRERFPKVSPGRAGGWRGATCQRVLATRTVLGEYQPRQRGDDGVFRPVGDAILGYYPAVVSEAEWDAARAVSTGKLHREGRPARVEPNLFTGLVKHAGFRAAVCLHSEGMHDSGKRYRYLGVRNALVDDQGGDGIPRWRYDFFECALLEAIEELTLADILPPDLEVSEMTSKLAAMGERLLKLESRAATLQRVAEDVSVSEER